LFLAMTLSCCHCNDQRDYLFYADTLRLAAGSFILHNEKLSLRVLAKQSIHNGDWFVTSFSQQLLFECTNIW